MGIFRQRAVHARALQHDGDAVLLQRRGNVRLADGVSRGRLRDDGVNPRVHAGHAHAGDGAKGVAGNTNSVTVDDAAERVRRWQAGELVHEEDDVQRPVNEAVQRGVQIHVAFPQQVHQRIPLMIRRDDDIPMAGQHHRVEIGLHANAALAMTEHNKRVTFSVVTDGCIPVGGGGNFTQRGGGDGVFQIVWQVVMKDVGFRRHGASGFFRRVPDLRDEGARRGVARRGARGVNERHRLHAHGIRAQDGRVRRGGGAGGREGERLSG